MSLFDGEGLAQNIWILDTSAVINVRELIVQDRRKEVLDELSVLVETDQLYYPKEVVVELEKGAKADRSDQLLAWARRNQENACRFGACYEELVMVMNHAVARLTPNPRQIDSKDDADPHVLATAIHARKKAFKPTIVTQDVRKVPPQVSLSDAAGAFWPSVDKSIRYADSD